MEQLIDNKDVKSILQTYHMQFFVQYKKVHSENATHN